MHEYIAGRFVAVVGESAVALLDPSLGLDDARQMWDLDQDGSRLSRWIELLAARGITTLPPFALVEARPEGLFVLVRGDLTVWAGKRTVTGRGYSTWYEELVPGATDFSIEVPGVDAGAAALPVSTGIVHADRIASRTDGEQHGGLTVAEEADAEGAVSEGSVAGGAIGDETDVGGVGLAPAAGVAGVGAVGLAGPGVASSHGTGLDAPAPDPADRLAEEPVQVEEYDETARDTATEDEAEADDADIADDATADDGEAADDATTADDDAAVDASSDDAEAGAATFDGEDPFQEPEHGEPVEGAEDQPADPFNEGAALEQSEDADAHRAPPGQEGIEHAAHELGEPMYEDGPAGPIVHDPGADRTVDEALADAAAVEGLDDALAADGLGDALAAEDELSLTAEPSALDGYVGEGPDDVSGDDGLIEDVPWGSPTGEPARAEGQDRGAADTGEIVQEVPSFDVSDTRVYRDEDETGDEQDSDTTGSDDHAPDAGQGHVEQGSDEHGSDVEQDRVEQGGGAVASDQHADDTRADDTWADDAQGNGNDENYDDVRGREAGADVEPVFGVQAHDHQDQGYGQSAEAATGEIYGGHAERDGRTEVGHGPEHDGATSMSGIAVGDYGEQALALVLPDGTTVAVDRPILLGRAPDAARFTGDAVPRIVQVRSPERDVSATHVEVRPAGDSVVVTDMDSTNGTVIMLPDQPAFRLHPRTGVPVPPGAYVELGTDAGFHVELVGQAPER